MIDGIALLPSWSRLRAVSTLSLLSLLLATATANAQTAPPPADPAAEAGRLIAEAEKAYAAGDKPRAEQAYEGALAIKRTFDVATNLGIVELELGKHREAAEHLDFATRNFPPTESRENKERLAKLFAEAKSKVASLRIEVDVPRARVTVGGRDEGETPLEGEAFAEPGRIKIQVEKVGYETESREIDVAAGLSETVKIGLRSSGEAPSETPIWPAVLLGTIAGAALATGVGLTVGSRIERSDAIDLVSACEPVDSGCMADGQDGIDQAALLQNVGFAMYGVAAASAIGMGLYLGLAPGGGEKTTWVVPSAGPSSAALQFGGRW